MAAFSLHQQYPAIPADSICLPYVSATKMDCVLDEFITNFSHIYASSEHCQNLASDHDHMEGSSFDASAHYSSCIEQLSIQNISCVTEKEIPQSLLIADKAEHGEQVTQTRVAADRKRKFRNWSSLDSANSKGAQQVIYKKLKGAKVATNEVEKDQNKANEEPTKRCIHVRAKRGQATDSHSLAERVRREKISEKMRMLQALVPGCDKVTGKALMLDEVINYVQSLQNQVEFLSMKLTSLHPMVYTFGLMDNDVMTFGSQVTNNDTALTIPLVQPTSSGYGSASLARALANANALASSATSSAASGSSFTSPLVDGSTNLMQHEQKGARSSYWGLNEQEGQNIINQFGFRATT